MKFAYEEVEHDQLRCKAPWLAIVGKCVVKCGERRDDRGVVEIVAVQQLWTDIEPVDVQIA